MESLKYKIMFFDVDGTLLDHSQRPGGFIPASTVASLRAMQKKGIKVFIATGRSPYMLDGVYPLFPFDGFVTTNGQYVIDKDRKVLRQAEIDPDEVRRLADISIKEDFTCIIAEEGEGYAVKVGEDIKKHYGAFDIPLPPLYDFSRLGKVPVLQCLAHVSPEKEHVFDGLTKVKCVDTGGFSYDVMPIDGGKHVGAWAAAQTYGIAQSETMAFGDGDNDAELLRWAGAGVAMGNGSPRCKEAGDYITTGVSEDGVKNALIHYGVLTEEEVAAEMAILVEENDWDRFKDPGPGGKKEK